MLSCISKLSWNCRRAVLMKSSARERFPFLEFEIHEIDEAKVRPGRGTKNWNVCTGNFPIGEKIVETLQVVYEMTGYDNPASAGEVTGRVVRELLFIFLRIASKKTDIY